MFKHRSLALLKSAISIGLILFLILKTDLNIVFESIRQVDIRFFALALAASALAILIRSYKWQLLLRVQGADLSLGRIHSFNYMALFFNNFFLGSVGGDIFRIYRTFNYPNSKSGALSSVIVEKLTNILILVLLVMTFGVLSFHADDLLITWEQTYRAFTVALFLLLIILVFGGIFFYTWYVTRFYKQFKLAQIIRNVIESVMMYRHYTKTIVLSLALSFVFYIVNIFSMYFFALTVSVDINLMYLAFIVPAVFLVVMIPISVNGVGLQEGTFFFYFNVLGIDSSSALLIALLPRIGMLIFGLIGALLYITENIKTARLKNYETLN